MDCLQKKEIGRNITSEPSSFLGIELKGHLEVGEIFLNLTFGISGHHSSTCYHIHINMHVSVSMCIQ